MKGKLQKVIVFLIFMVLVILPANAVSESTDWSSGTHIRPTWFNDTINEPESPEAVCQAYGLHSGDNTFYITYDTTFPPVSPSDYTGGYVNNAETTFHLGEAARPNGTVSLCAWCGSVPLKCSEYYQYWTDEDYAYTAPVPSFNATPETG